MVYCIRLVIAMNLRNNNREVIRILAKKSYQSNGGRNRVLIFAVALAVIIVFCVFSIASGRAEAEQLASTRNNGIAPSYFIENPTKQQYQKVKEQPYVQYVGEEWSFGAASKHKELLFSCIAVSEKTFEKIYVPAFTDIMGRYPVDSNEIMLSIRSLEDIGIKKPKLGMKIQLDISVDGKLNTRAFMLSGYFTDYQQTELLQEGFFSRSYAGCARQPDFLRIQTKEVQVEDQEKTVAKLREDAGISSQQTVDSYYIRHLLSNSYGSICGFVLIILLCAFLLINNVTYISLTKDIRHYGILITLGATQKQIEKIVLRQVLRISIIGILIGSGISCLIVLFLMPALLEHLYLIDYGPVADLIGFHPSWLAATVILVLITTLISAMGPARKVSRCTPIDAQNYRVPGKRKPAVCKSKKGAKLSSQAWRSAFQNKRKSAVTLLSVVLGIIVTLTAVMIIDGMDMAAEITKEPDFSIYTCYTPGMDYPNLLDKETENKIRNLVGIKTVESMYGNFFCLDKADPVWKPLINDVDLLGGAVMVDDAYIDKLAKFAKKKKLKIDIEGLKRGESAVEVYANRLSGQELKKANERIGDAFKVSDLYGSKLGSLKFAGFLDQSKKGFPENKLIMHSLYMPVLMMSEKAFKRAGLEIRIQSMELTVKHDAEASAKKELSSILKQRSREMRRFVDGREALTFTAKSDSSSYNAELMRARRVMAYGITALFMLMGIMNYFNILITGILLRKRELALLECMGMTRKQLRSVLILEGCYYSVIIAVLSFVLSTATLFVADKYMKEQYYTFIFNYPWTEMLVMLGALFLFSVCIPLFMYRKRDQESMAERLRYKG